MKEIANKSKKQYEKETESGLLMLPREEQGKNCIAYQDKRKWKEKMMKNDKEKELSIFVLSISPSNITMVCMTTDTWQINRNIDKDYKWH